MKKVYYNAKVYTGSEKCAEAFAVENGLFTAVGSNEEVFAAAGEDAERVDLGGKFVTPGFIDSHLHVLSYGMGLNTAQLGEHTDSLRGMIDYVKAFAAANPPAPGGWIRGRGWNHDYFTDVHREPTRWDLDEISTEHPVLLTRCCGHVLTVNSKALELLGITGESVSPVGGEIGMENGEPNGLLYDSAMDAAYAACPAPDKETVKELIRLAAGELNACGITSVHSDDYTSTMADWRTVKAAFEELDAAGELTVRVYEQTNICDVDELKAFLAAGNNTGVGSDFFRTGPLKVVEDGSLGARTAFLSAPYADDPHTCGFPIYPREDFEELLDVANTAGMQIAVHAIGDKCLDYALDAVDRALQRCPREDHRHGVVHCQISRPDQLERIAALKMHVYAQSIFLDYDSHIVEARVGSETAASSYAWKTLLDKGVTVSNGTDCPVETPYSLKGIQCAVTRQPLRGDIPPYLPHEAFSVREALDSYTVAGAYGSFEENKKGRIRPGFLADFAILDDSPFAVPTDKIKDIRVLETYLAGKKVF